MMGAVVTLFANVSNSVRDRRAVIEISGQLRHARNMLQQDLQGATCRASPGADPKKTRVTSNHRRAVSRRERKPAAGLQPRGLYHSTLVSNPEIDHTTSIIPTSNLLDTTATGKSKWITDGAALGDGDDV